MVDVKISKMDTNPAPFKWVWSVVWRQFFSNWDSLASKERVIREWWTGKDLKGSGRGLNSRYYPGIRLERPSKTTKTAVSIAGLRDLTPGSSKYEGVLTTRPSGFSFRRADVQTSEVDAKLELVTVGPWNSVRLQILKWSQTFSKAIFVKNKRYERGGRLKVKTFRFYGDN
jgi:hypothetical protein